MKLEAELLLAKEKWTKLNVLFIGEKVGKGIRGRISIAVDPSNAQILQRKFAKCNSVLSVSKKGGLLSAPDTYMEKIAVGSGLPKNIVDLDNSVEKNIKLLCEAKNTNSRKNYRVRS